MLWQQTKESILEARGILTSSNSLTGKHRRVGPSRMTKRVLLSGDHHHHQHHIRERIRLNAGKLVNGDYARVPLDETSVDILK